MSDLHIIIASLCNSFGVIAQAVFECVNKFARFARGPTTAAMTFWSLFGAHRDMLNWFLHV